MPQRQPGQAENLRPLGGSSTGVLVSRLKAWPSSMQRQGQCGGGCLFEGSRDESQVYTF